eukprot:NODE_44_length_33449_cov_1.575742.p28 type:complete len:158 gc:universal NODE_44_length_33449_cov_1.575742:4346-4819(+)
MIVHSLIMDATLWSDYSSRHPDLQRNMYKWSLKFVLIYMTMLLTEVILMTFLFVSDLACPDVLLYIIFSYISVIMALCFSIFTIKWKQSTLYYANSKCKLRSNIAATVLLIGVLVPLAGSYFVVFENSCQSNKLIANIVISVFVVQMIRSPMVLAIL